MTACTPKWEKMLKEQMIENPSTQAEKDKNKILEYALAQEMEVQSTESGIYYMIERPGEGDRAPKVSDIVTTHYRGTLLDGKEFDSSYKRNQPLDFPLSNVIKGWQESIPLLKKGGKGTFLIPSELAYGSRGAGSDIPPNAVLRFDIELLNYASPEEKETMMKTEQAQKIEAYLKEQNMSGFQKTDSGIFYKIDAEGEGEARPDASSKIKAHYTGKLLDGTVFDSSYKRNQPLDFPLGGVIQGWQEAIPMLGKGGKGTFIIPSHLAYGPRGAGGVIPPNAILNFDIEVLDF